MADASAGVLSLDEAGVSITGSSAGGTAGVSALGGVTTGAGWELSTGASAGTSLATGGLFGVTAAAGAGEDAGADGAGGALGAE